MVGNEKLIEIRNLKKYFQVKGGLFQRVTGYVKAVDDVSLDIFEGETVGLVGESGCGKSTFGLTILQLERPTAGSVFFKGEDMVAKKGEDLRHSRTPDADHFSKPLFFFEPPPNGGTHSDRTDDRPWYL